MSWAFSDGAQQGARGAESVVLLGGTLGSASKRRVGSQQAALMGAWGHLHLCYPPQAEQLHKRTFPILP